MLNDIKNIYKKQKYFQLRNEIFDFLIFDFLIY